MLYDVRLMDFGLSKINTIRVLRAAFPPMGLFEAKTTADKVPITIARGVPNEEVDRINLFFTDIARLEVVLSDTNLSLSKFNRAEISLPTTANAWVDAPDLKYGEVVTTVDPKITSSKDLRIVTEGGIINLEGKIVANFSDGTSYQRLPVGTKVTITVT